MASAPVRASVNSVACSPKHRRRRTSPICDPGSTTYVGAIETAEDFGYGLYSTFTAPFKSSIYIKPGNIYGKSPLGSTPMTWPRRKAEWFR